MLCYWGCWMDGIVFAPPLRWRWCVFTQQCDGKPHESVQVFYINQPRDSLG